MPEPIRHPLTTAQQQQITNLQQVLTAQQTLVNAYVQAIADGIVTEGPYRWRLDGAELVGDPVPPAGPALVKD